MLSIKLGDKKKKTKNVNRVDFFERDGATCSSALVSNMRNPLSAKSLESSSEKFYFTLFILIDKYRNNLRSFIIPGHDQIPI